MQRNAPPGPIVKWAGGKTCLLSELIARAPDSFDRYYEPFCGGAALFFRLAPERAVLADVNADLIAMYEAVRADVDPIIRQLKRHQARHDQAYYYKLRERWNSGGIKGQAARAAALIYLNKTCFNGLWRVNNSGAFNVPMGRYTDPKICVPDALHAAQTVLARAEILRADYSATVAPAEHGDFIYFDPPYHPVTATANFTGYAAGGFGTEDQQRLAALARDLVGRGCHVMLSNSDTPFVRKLYKGFKLARVKRGGAMNSNTTRRGTVTELIITGVHR